MPLATLPMKFRPIDWSGPVTQTRRSQHVFTATWTSTLQLLSRELEHLAAANVVLQADFRERDLLIDGSRPRAGAPAPDFPGVRVVFDSRHGPLVYETDAFDGWQANVRAIALALESLRQVDRYGVTHAAEQYKGWRAIEAGDTSGSFVDRGRAARFVAQHSAPIGTSISAEADTILSGIDGRNPVLGEGYARRAVRAAAKRLHPDTGGDPDLFRQLQDARQVLGL